MPVYGGLFTGTSTAFSTGSVDEACGWTGSGKGSIVRGPWLGGCCMVGAVRLNPEQYAAVFHRGGPLLVLAGAGSGKTRVITERIAALMEEGVSPEVITAITFTNKAAREMQQRVAARVGERARDIWIGTFHALGLAILRAHPEAAGRSPGFSIVAERERRDILATALEDARITEGRDALDQWLGRIRRIKSGREVRDRSEVEVLARYEALLKAMNAVDLDDLVLLPVHAIREHEEVRIRWRERARHLLVDECQDTNPAQYAFIRALSPEGQGLCVVGDDDQSIYGWRGAEAANMRRFAEELPHLCIVRLVRNYRSTATILAAANTLIARNAGRIGKELVSARGGGEPISVLMARTPEEEAERVALDIRMRRATTGRRWDAFAVLARTGHELRLVERALRAQRIPYYLAGGRSFFDRAEIQDAVAYLRLVANPKDDLAFMRAIARPKRGVGKETLAQLAERARGCDKSLLEAADDPACLAGLRAAAELRAFALLVGELEDAFARQEADAAYQALLERSGITCLVEEEARSPAVARSRLDALADLGRWWQRHAERGGDVAGFVQTLAAVRAREEQEEEPQGCVRLLTVHAAKGLEFDEVYLIGFNEGRFPHAQALDEGRIEEERRLAYVAITRARFRLTVSLAERRGRLVLEPSRFLDEMGRDHLRWLHEEEAGEDEVEAHLAYVRAILERDRG